MTHLHDKVSGLVDGELAGAARSRALHHLRRCGVCRDEVQATLGLKQRLGGLAAAEPPGDLLAALGSLPSPALCAAPTVQRRQTGRLVLAGAATMSVALLGAAYVVGAPEEAPTATVTPPIDQFTADFADATAAAPLSDPAVGALDADGSPMTLLAVGQATGSLAVRPAPGGSGDHPRAVELLGQAMDVGRRLAYTGERRVAVLDGVGPSVVSVSVEHVPGQGVSFDLGGIDDDATFVATREAAQAQNVASSLDLLVDAFDLTITGRGWVAGRAATVVTASRSTEPVARFWIDDQSGLLLRRDLFDQGQLVRSSQFTSLKLSGQTFLAHLPPELEAPQATALSMTFAPSLNDQGWVCPQELPGDFQLVGLRSLPEDVVRATYTDGLSTATIFEQRGALDPRGLDGYARTVVEGQPVYELDGLPSVAVWESDGTIYSLVADAPGAAFERVVEALPHVAAEPPSSLDRVGSGLRRLGSLVNPAD